MFSLLAVRSVLTVLLLVIGLLPVAAAPPDPAGPSDLSTSTDLRALAAGMKLPAVALQGEVLPVVIYYPPAGSPPVAGATVELILPNGERHRTPAWRAASHSQSGRSAWIALLGVPSTAATGEAEVVVRFLPENSGPDGGVAEQTFPVRITEGRFRRERIALNRDMTDLRTTDDPRRAEQSRILWELIHRMDIQSRIHSGRFRLPVSDFRETSFFGDRREFSYSDGESARSIHNGMDLAAPTGTPVIAPGSGRVVMAEDRIITGHSVVLEHLPGVFTVYYHLDSIEVSLGDLVTAGSPLGTVGSTGLSTGPHLHWELRVSGVAVDPEVYLSTPLVDTAALVRSLSQLP